MFWRGDAVAPTGDGMSQELFDFVKKLHDESVELLRDVKFNAALPSDRLILGT
jgi:hypothetical protein